MWLLNLNIKPKTNFIKINFFPLWCHMEDDSLQTF